MKLITIQKDFKYTNDILYPSAESDNEKRAPNCYKKLFNDFYRMTKIRIDKAIWCFSRLFFDQEVNLGYEHIARMLEMGVRNNPYAYLLDIPQDYCLELSFYDWADQLSKEEDPDGEPDFHPIWSNIYKRDQAELQCIIPYIKKEWIIEVVKIEARYLDSNHKYGPGLALSGRKIFKQGGIKNNASKQL